MKRFSFVIIILAAIIVFFYLKETKESTNHSARFSIEDSCHTCFSLEKTPQTAESKKEALSPNHRFALENAKIYSKDGKSEIGTLLKGFGGEEIGTIGDKTILKLEGFLKEGDEVNLYANENLSLAVVLLKDAKAQKQMEVAISTKDLTKNENEVWSKSEFIYYDNCSMCHAAHAPKEHTIQEWDGIYGTMKAFAMPTEQDDKLIWEYLQSHAIDGFSLSD
ncbi:hypothetical protein B6S12_03450 [Helicobacter valdiviensis]|uniref:Cytochrome C n=1 Tax=Helicobacter valdiviensis TaxID=1458358 RepID=A0A2W6MX47_9HELI|nr:hypothetical protein [Helicobacter valdiviensis]PZT48539.1 hypothetical protein B6S12_03450 [Helicobacter valdiviensis]